MAALPRCTDRLKAGRVKTRPYTLPEAASLVFALTAILPLLVFAWTLYRLNAMSRPQAQLGLGLALAAALLGFYIFRVLMGRMSMLIQAVGKATERGARSTADARTNPVVLGSRPQSADTQPHPMMLRSRSAADARTNPVARGPRPQSVMDTRENPVVPESDSAADPLANPVGPGPGPQAAADAQADLRVPGIGTIQEVQDLSQAMAVLWKAEAAALQGRQVLVSVINSSQPIVGALIEVTDDGLLLEQGAGLVGVSYTRISAIEAENSSSEN
jgi:hypothetical protein